MRVSMASQGCIIEVFHRLHFIAICYNDFQINFKKVFFNYLFFVLFLSSCNQPHQRKVSFTLYKIYFHDCLYVLTDGFGHLVS